MLKRNHSAFSRICYTYKRVVKYKRNVTFLEARKIEESNVKVNTYANAAQRASSISNNNSQPDKYKIILIKKLVQLGPNDWPVSRTVLKKLHSAEICQTATQIKEKKLTKNIHTNYKNISTENFKLLIRPPIPKIDNSRKKTNRTTNSKPNDEKLKHVLTTPAKSENSLQSKIILTRATTIFIIQHVKARAIP